MNIFTQDLQNEKLINIILDYIKDTDAIDLDIKKYCEILQTFKKENPEYLQGTIAFIINNENFLTNAKEVSKQSWENSQRKLSLINNLWFLAPLLLYYSISTMYSFNTYSNNIITIANLFSWVQFIEDLSCFYEFRTFNLILKNSLYKANGVLLFLVFEWLAFSLSVQIC
jgi:hypothetical protein